MSINFVHLHNHSEYSMLDGAQKTDDMANTARDLGQPAIAITDHGTMAGVLSFYNSCRNAGVKPIIGLEAYTTPLGVSRFSRESFQKRELKHTPNYIRDNYHLILLAKNYTGYQNLCQLVTYSNSEGFFKRPRIDIELLKKYSEGIIVSNACVLGEVNNLLLSGNYERAKKVALTYREIFGDDYYFEIMNHELSIERAIMDPIRQLGRELSIPVIATNDSHYTLASDVKLQKTLMLAGFKKSWADSNVKGYFFDEGPIAEQKQKLLETNNDSDAVSDPIFEMSPELYLKNSDEMIKALTPGSESFTPEEELEFATRELQTTLEIADKCNCNLPIINPANIKDYHMPYYTISKDIRAKQWEKEQQSYSMPRELGAAIVPVVAKVRPDKGRTLQSLLSEHELDMLRFITWICERRLDTLVRPKIEAKGESLSKKYWIQGDTNNIIQIDSAHNSPDELFYKEKISEGYSTESILDIYRTRLYYELSIITRQGFLDYFGIVQDYINYSKTNGGQIGAGRGSGAGSLINYLLGITSVDPITSELLFERFLNPDRVGLPDIDSDISPSFRDNKLIPHLREKYGTEYTAKVTTYNYFYGKAALRAAARLLFNPPLSVKLGDELSKLVEDTPKLDLRTQVDGSNPQFQQKLASSLEARQVYELALQLQGRISGEGVHASAFIIAPEPIINLMPLTVSKDDRKEAEKTGKGSTDYLIQYDGTQVQELLGFVKFDLLGLKDLDVIEETLQHIEKVYNIKINIEQLPLDEKKVFNMLVEGYNTGIFQFDSSATAENLIIASEASSIGDLSLINALNRPGPLGMNYDKDFIRNKHNPEHISYFSPIAEKYLKGTYGVVAYQETIIQLAQDPNIIGLTPGQADHLRKVISKKKKKDLDDMEALVRKTAKTNKVPQSTVDVFWQVALAAGSYSFNKSHALCYAITAYRGAFLKYFFPECFFAAMANIKPKQKQKDRVPDYLREARSLGVTIKQPHVNYSNDGYSVPEPKLLALGIGGIKGVGVSGKMIIDERNENGTYPTIWDFLMRTGNATTKSKLEALAKAGALDNLTIPRKALIEDSETLIEFKKRGIEIHDFLQKPLKNPFFSHKFGINSITQYTANLPINYNTEYPITKLVAEEYKQYGMSFIADPFDLYSNSIHKTEANILNINQNNTQEDKQQTSQYLTTKELINILESNEPLANEYIFIGFLCDKQEFKKKNGATFTFEGYGPAQESKTGKHPTTYTVKALGMYNKNLELKNNSSLYKMFIIKGNIQERNSSWGRSLWINNAIPLTINNEYILEQSNQDDISNMIF